MSGKFALNGAIRLGSFGLYEECSTLILKVLCDLPECDSHVEADVTVDRCHDTCKLTVTLTSWESGPCPPEELSQWVENSSDVERLCSEVVENYIAEEDGT